MAIIGKDIRDYRKKHKLSQKELAQQIGVHYITIQNYEGGKTIPKNKVKLFETLFKEENSNVRLQEPSNEYNDKSRKVLNNKFNDISDDDIAHYIIINKERFLKNELFSEFLDKESSLKALKLIKEL